MDLVVVRGGGDLASGIIHKLSRSGFRVLVLDVEEPLAIRRQVSFCEAVYSGEIVVEGVRGLLVQDLDEAGRVLDQGHIPVLVDTEGSCLASLRPLALVDAIIAKKNLGTRKDMAAITLAVGPGFEAGVDVDLVVESKRGHYLGTLIDEGFAVANTGRPGEVLGYVEERVLRASGDGQVETFYKIGDRVEAGDLICLTGGQEVYAEISGILRGIIQEGLMVRKGLKIGDIDPRGVRDHAFTISDKARTIAGGVLEGILYLKKERGL